MSEVIARKIKEARDKLRLTQSDAAKEWGIPLSTLIKWETDKRTPKGFALKALEEKLDAILASK